MLKKIWLTVLLISTTVALTATAAPVLEAFTGKFENGNIAVLTGQDFGARGLLTSTSGLMALDKEPIRVVVLGDTPAYADCQVRYQLLAKAWANTSIIVEFDLPTALQERPLYLFVVDDTGQASNGLGPLVYGVGIEAPEQAPDQPGAPVLGQPTF